MESFINQSTAIYKECNRILKAGGFIANILGNSYIKGQYYPITLHIIKSIEAANLELYYQFWSLRTHASHLNFPWNRSTLDCKAKKADNGVGWDIHEDIIIAHKKGGS